MIQLRSYATLAELFNDWFGTNMRFPVFSFGFFVGMAFLVAGWILYKELKRKKEQGLLQSTNIKIVVGKPASTSELIFNGIIGFLVGFKIGGMILNWSTFNDAPQAFVFSGE